MPSRRILFADNNPNFLNHRAEFLEREGFDVLKTTTPEEAERLLQDELVHLAILDIRLADDDDERDISGLLLARQERYRAVPKIMLTGFPSYEHVREALGHLLKGLPPAVGFLAKREGAEVLVSTVLEAFANHIPVNWDLVIQLEERHHITFPYLVSLVTKDERLVARAEEMEDLFRRLFRQADQIKLDRLLWQRDGRLALVVFAFAKDKAPESLLVVCGRMALMQGEARRYQDYAPHAPGPAATLLSQAAETAHFGARLYRVAGAQLETTSSLRELYQSGPEKSFNAVLKSLFEEPLADWSQEKQLLAEQQSLADLYRGCLNLTPEQISPAMFAERMQTVLRQAPTLGLNIERHANNLTWRLGGQSFSYPDPTPFIYQNLLAGGPALLCNTSGALTGDNILTDHNERAWLTDFAEAGLAPLLWNFVTLEAVIRFDWVETDKLAWLHQMEQALVEGEFSRLDASDIEAPLRKPLRAIQTLRRLAMRAVGSELSPYQVGILFQAAKRLADSNSTARLMPGELARLTHALIAAAMICGHLAQGASAATQQTAGGAGLRIDSDNYQVWVDGRPVHLTGQGYELLHYLHEHANQVRTRRDIVEEVFRQKYDETDESQTQRLNTAIRRLRERIEPDPERPRYLRTEPGRGYRLVC